MAISALSVFPVKEQGKQDDQILRLSVLHINYFSHLIGCETINIPKITSSFHGFCCKSC